MCCGNYTTYGHKTKKYISDHPVVIELYIGKYYNRKMGWLCYDCGKKFSTVKDLYEKESSISKIPEEIILKIINS